MFVKGLPVYNYVQGVPENMRHTDFFTSSGLLKKRLASVKGFNQFNLSLTLIIHQFFYSKMSAKSTQIVFLVSYILGLRVCNKSTHRKLLTPVYIIILYDTYIV